MRWGARKSPKRSQERQLPGDRDQPQPERLDESAQARAFGAEEVDEREGGGEGEPGAAGAGSEPGDERGEPPAASADQREEGERLGDEERLAEGRELELAVGVQRVGAGDEQAQPEAAGAGADLA
jgi:hypothetical protein